MVLRIRLFTRPSGNIHQWRSPYQKMRGTWKAHRPLRYPCPSVAGRSLPPINIFYCWKWTPVYCGSADHHLPPIGIMGRAPPLPMRLRFCCFLLFCIQVAFYRAASAIYNHRIFTNVCRMPWRQLEKAAYFYHGFGPVLLLLVTSIHHIAGHSTTEKLLYPPVFARPCLRQHNLLPGYFPVLQAFSFSHPQNIALAVNIRFVNDL